MWVCGLDWAGPGYGQVLCLIIRMDLLEVDVGMRTGLGWPRIRTGVIFDY